MRAYYLTYDGALDPLGRSQVVPYLIGLADEGIDLTLVSFEKSLAAGPRRRELSEELAHAGVSWIPLKYHRAPRLPATAWDVAAGVATIRFLARSQRPELVHCRGELPMLMARMARMRSPLLYDVRGFFADERVESGSWEPNGIIDRTVRRVEARNLAAADGLVVLTQRALALLGQRRRPLPRYRVIPTCTDLRRFMPRDVADLPSFGLAYCGSLGTWYMSTEMLEFVRVAAPTIGGRTLLLTPHADQIRGHPLLAESDVISADPLEVPRWLKRARASFFFIRPTHGKGASCPTKVGEALACGLPVVCNRGIGDLDEIIERESIGVLVDAFTPEAYQAAAGRLSSLLQDPELALRCRAVAERRFALDSGVRAYASLYEELGSGTELGGRATRA